MPVLYKPEHPRSHTIGRVRKYEAPQGLPPMFDVHPFNASLVADPAEPVLVTEGIKKADALTFAGACVIALSGVFNWRSPYGTLGDWANVWLRGRPDTVVFDSDAATNLNVLRAMRRLGRWLKAKGAKVSYCIPPSPLGAGMKIGADDFLAGGGTLQQLLDSSRPSLAHWEPGPDTWLMSSVLAERLEQDVMVDEFRYVHGIGWLAGSLAGSLAGARRSPLGRDRRGACGRVCPHLHPRAAGRGLRVGCRPSAAERAGQASVHRAHQGGGWCVALLSAGNIYRWVMCHPPPRRGDLRMDVDRATSAAGACAGLDERLPARRCCR